MANKGRPKLEKTKDKVLSIRISDEMYQRLLQYTEKHNESMTKVATKGLEKILSRDKQYELFLIKEELMANRKDPRGRTLKSGEVYI